MPVSNPAHRFVLPHAAFASPPQTFNTHFAIARQQISHMPTSRTPGSLLSAMSQHDINA